MRFPEASGPHRQGLAPLVAPATVPVHPDHVEFLDQAISVRNDRYHPEFRGIRRRLAGSVPK